MEDASGKNSISLTSNQSLIEVFQGASATTGNNWHAHCLGNGTSELDVISRPVTIGIHAGKQ